MERITNVTVFYHDRKVGTLSMGVHGNCVFEYTSEWIEKGFSISPLKLPLQSGLFEADYMPFQGNFGIFEDSLPGGYGEYMLRKTLSKGGIDYNRLTPIERLSIIGDSGMGALCYRPTTHIEKSNEAHSLDELQQMALETLSEKTTKHANLLYLKSGNSGGVRPKALIKDAEGEWLVKFRHTFDPDNIGEIEYLYTETAKACGITVPTFKLMEGRYFATKRFDRENGTCLHVATASALLNEPITPPKMDYHSLLQLTGFLTQSPDEVEQQFRRMAFNIYSKNYDDHARNFSFICREGRWTLSPAYDLTNDYSLGQHASTVNYNGLPTDQDMIKVGTNIRITSQRCMEILDEVKTIVHEKLKFLINRS